MSTTAVPLAEYLHTDYSPDVDYIDGELEERNASGCPMFRWSQRAPRAA